MEKNNRAPVFAGSFYPAEKKILSEMVKKFVSNAKVTPPKNTILKALIVPHAGYAYSGQTAGFAYSALKSSNAKKIILFGPSHQTYLQGAYSFSGEWETPIGQIKVSPADLPVLKNDSEHSLEVQLPFLQSVLKQFEFTPIIYGDIEERELADIIHTEQSDDSVLIASSDLSHYLSYAIAKKTDKETIATILSLDLETFLKVGDACGKIGIAALIILAKKNNWKPLLVDYRNSGDTAGDKKGVVGYASIAFVEEK